LPFRAAHTTRKSSPTNREKLPAALGHDASHESAHVPEHMPEQGQSFDIGLGF
jgi:hypothetical protein